MEFGIEKRTMQTIEVDKRETTEGIDLQNQERIRAFGEEENYKYWEILEVDISKQADMKDEKWEKSTSEEQENFPKPNSHQKL